MKNSTLLRLFLICLGVPLARATSSTPKPKTGALILRDETNTAAVIQLKNQGTLMAKAPRGQTLLCSNEKKTRISEKLPNVLRDKSNTEEVCRPGINTRQRYHL